MSTPTIPQLHFNGNGLAHIENRVADSFACGTVSGAWHFYEGFPEHPHVPVFCIIDVRNEEDKRKNGDFRRFLTQLFGHCAERKCDVLAVDVAGYLVPNLIQKYGFEKLPHSTHLVRRCYAGGAVGA